MKKISEPIVFFGNERLATAVRTEAPTLQALIEAGYNVVAVVSNYEKATSRNPRQLEIAAVAKRYGIPVLLPDRPADIIEQLAALKATLGVLVAYGKIVPQSVIDVFPKGIINIHPSLLPLYRGPTPIEQVILDGAQKTGVSIMQLVKEMDAGPVFAQSEVTLSGTETKQQLADQLLAIGSSMLLEILPGILEGDIVSQAQDESQATYDRLLTKSDGTIDWTEPAIQLERAIRAFADWPKSRTRLGSTEVIVTQSQVIEAKGKPGTIIENKDRLVVATTDGALEIVKLKPAGKSEMTAQAFLAGHPNLS